MTTNFQQTGNDLEQYLILTSNKNVIPVASRKSPSSFWSDSYSGRVWFCGNDTYGQVGDGRTPSNWGGTLRYTSPIQIGSTTNWKKFSFGNWYTTATRSDGTLWVWGYAEWGALALGLNGGTHRSSATQIGSLNTWKDVNSYSYSSTGVQTNGTLWSWGWNSNGQLGQNDTAHRLVPTQIGSLTTWKQAFPGIAIKTDGTLWTWGDNSSGNLGQNDTTNRSSPTQVGTLTNWNIISSGSNVNAAIKTDGTLWTWGNNGYGQLGHNDTTNRSSPTQVGTLTNWQSLNCRFNKIYAIKTDGTLWAWGSNSNGMLGLGNLTHRSSPVQVGSLTNWYTIADGAAQSQVHVVKTDGTMWGWGYNPAGELGNGTDNNSYSSPIQIGTLTTWFNASSGQNCSYLFQFV